MAGRTVASRARLYDSIEKAMARFPDLRVGQLLFNVTYGVADEFYIEDEALADCIDSYVVKQGGAK